MKIFTLLLLSLLYIGISVSAQTISITTTNTSSICYNDGTLTIHATGGTAPYTDSILSGPTNPNLTYPIALASGQNVFTNLPHGSFSIRIHDAAGHSGTFTASVGGTYNFPADTLYQTTYYINGIGTLFRDTLMCDVYPGTGRPPFQYALSSTGANSGFGPYQSTNYFTHLCSGQYWVRVRDSCGNIFTNDHQQQTTLGAYPACFNIAAGTSTIAALGGVPPYTFTIKNISNTVIGTNNTGNFSSLPYSSYYYYTITDSCGQSYSNQYKAPTLTFTGKCPFDSSVYVDLFSLTDFFPYHFTCLNCSPVQYDSVLGFPTPAKLFRHLSLNQYYKISWTDACGNTLTDSIKPIPSVSVNGPVYTSCNSMVIGGTYSNYATSIPTSDIDSVIVIIGGVRYFSTTGTFTHMPNTTSPTGYDYDTVYLYTHGGCQGMAEISTQFPHIGTYSVLYPSAGPNCAQVWNADFGNRIYDAPETYYLISSTTHDTVAESPSGPYNGTSFYYLPPSSTYTLVSDSGCSKSFSTRPYPTMTHSVASYVTCTGQPTLKFEEDIEYLPYISLDEEYLVKIYQNGNLILQDTGLYNNVMGGYLNHFKTFTLPDSGTYMYKVYKINPSVSQNDTNFANNPYLTVITYNLNTHYDSICPVDSGLIYVSRSSVPFPFVQTAYLCHGTSPTPPQLVIYGGSIPYTIQIPGLDTFTMNTNSINFPTTHVGTYSIIAYDNCGISRSFTFSITDTCSVCGWVRANSDTSICRGRSTTLSATPQYAGGSYLWSPGGATSQTITVSPTTTTSYIVTYSASGCLPTSDTIVVTVTNGPSLLVSDTAICEGGTAVLTATASPSGGLYLWTQGGATTNQITVSPSATTSYSVSYSLAQCPSITDSGTVTVYGVPVSHISYTHVGGYYTFYDSITNSMGPYTYLWNFGDNTPTSDSASPTHHYVQANTYKVKVIVTGPCGSDTIISTFTTVTGLIPLSIGDRVSVYPNPNQGNFIIAIDDLDGNVFTAEITDIVGRSIYKENIHGGENKFNIPLNPGTYLIKISDGNTSTIKMMTVK